MTTAKEHMKWCKERALAYLDRESEWYSPKEAVSSMLSDLRKHEVTRKLLNDSLIGMLGIMSAKSHREAESFITGFLDY